MIYDLKPYFTYFDDEERQWLIDEIKSLCDQFIQPFENDD